MTINHAKHLRNHTATPWELPTGKHNAISLQNVKKKSFFLRIIWFEWIFSNESTSWNRKENWLIHTHSARTMDCVVLWSLCTYLDKRHLLRDWKTNPCRVLQFYTHTFDLGAVCLAAFLPLRGQYGPPRGVSDWPLGPSITASIQSCELWSCDAGSAAVHSSTHLSTSICSSCLCGCNPELILLFGVCMNHMKVGWRVYCSICPSGQGDIALTPRG